MGVTPRGHSRSLGRVLTDFGCEYFIARAAESVQEHYGFELGSSASQTVTSENARRAREALQEQYIEPFRILATVGSEHVIAQTDGAMIHAVGPGKRKGKRPRERKEMRLVAVQAKASTTTVYAAAMETVAQARGRSNLESGRQKTGGGLTVWWAKPYGRRRPELSCQVSSAPAMSMDYSGTTVGSFLSFAGPPIDRGPYQDEPVWET